MGLQASDDSLVSADCGWSDREEEEWRRVEQGAYTASLCQGVATVSRKCPLAGLFQLVVTRILYDGFKPRLHTDTQQRLASQRPTHRHNQETFSTAAILT